MSKEFTIFFSDVPSYDIDFILENKVRVYYVYNNILQRFYSLEFFNFSDMYSSITHIDDYAWYKEIPRFKTDRFVKLVDFNNFNELIEMYPEEFI